VLQRVKKERNVLQTIKRRKVDWIHYILRRKHVIEGKKEGRIEVTKRRGRRRKQLVDDLKETRGYCKLKEEEALDRTISGTRYGRGCGPVARQATE
jgi:hypothetical protein